MIRIAVADDQPLIREGFGQIVARTPDLELVGDAANGREAVILARERHPDVFLMDVRMPVLDGIEATSRITEEHGSAIKVIILTTFDLDDYVYGALKAGASGFLLKDVGPEALIAAIEVVAAGDGLLAPSVTRRLIERFIELPHPGLPDESRLAFLTEREKEVLALVGRGLSNHEIADELYLSPATVKTHISRTLAKLHARDRAQLVVAAYESGLVTPGS